MPNTQSIGKKPEVKGGTIPNYYKINILELSANHHDSMESANSHGRPFKPREILNLFNENKDELERLKGSSYWLKGGLENGISGHCTIDKMGDVVNISGKEWIGLFSNKKIFIIPGNNPPHLSVMATGDGSITYIQVNFSVDPGEKARRVIYAANKDGESNSQLLRVEENK